MHGDTCFRFHLRTLVLAVAALSATPVAFGQAAASSDEPRTWDMFVGGSYVKSYGATGGQGAGWDASVTERPYASMPWLGGTIEASGAYTGMTLLPQSGSSTGTEQFYTFMGGPSVTGVGSRFRPFAHLLFGGSVDHQQTSGGSLASGGESAAVRAQTLSLAGSNAASGSAGMNENTASFGLAAGVGFEIPVKSAWALRAQGDWLKIFESSTSRPNLVRASFGVDYRF